MDKKKRETADEGARRYAGVAADIADKEKVSQKLVDQETKILNNNPRNDDE